MNDLTETTRKTLTTETEIQPQDAPLGRLPFTFAKRNGVILTRNDDGEAVILVKPGASHTALAEANRISGDRKSTRLNSSHVRISYAVFCLKKKIVPAMLH